MAGTSTGGCACGAIRYEISADPVMSANCYCRDCQRSTGGAMAPVIVVPKSAFRLVRGDLKYHSVIGDSGNAASIGLHSAFGFQHAGLLQAIGWKHDRWVDSVLMTRPLDLGPAMPPVERLPQHG